MEQHHWIPLQIRLWVFLNLHHCLRANMGIMLQLFFSSLTSLARQLAIPINFLLTVLLERLMPKRDFCYFTPCMALLSSFHLWMSSYFMCS